LADGYTLKDSNYPHNSEREQSDLNLSHVSVKGPIRVSRPIVGFIFEKKR